MTGLSALARAIDRLNDGIGRAVSWLALALVLVQFLVVLARYVFGWGSIELQESILYLHATLFLLGAAYTLRHDGHVRVDIFYRAAPARVQALINLVGALVFLLPTMGLIFWLALPYVERSWAVLEGSRETSGLPFVYLLKSMILAFSGLMFLQGLSVVVHAVETLRSGEPLPRSGSGLGPEAG